MHARSMALHLVSPWERVVAKSLASLATRLWTPKSRPRDCVSAIIVSLEFMPSPKWTHITASNTALDYHDIALAQAFDPANSMAVGCVDAWYA